MNIFKIKICQNERLFFYLMDMDEKMIFCITMLSKLILTYS